MLTTTIHLINLTMSVPADMPADPVSEGPHDDHCYAKAHKSTHNIHTQWSNPGMEDHSYAKAPPWKTVTAPSRRTKASTAPSPDSSPSVADDLLKEDKDCLLYTGIPLLEFNTLVTCLQSFARTSTMPVVDQIFMTLMKLRQNFVMADLANRFKVSTSQVSKTIKFWIGVMAEHTKDLIPWLPRETIKATMPQAFLRHFPNTTCVIDCTESVLQKAKNLDSRTESYSHYYACNTVKYLVATAPSGVIMYISDAYGGKCSDRHITENSGFLNYLRAGDEVMADRGFTIQDFLDERKVRLVLPAFTRKKAQLTNEQVTRTRRIANVRIHVERAIRRLKVFKILSHTVPITLAPKIDQILKICAGLVNLRGELISSK